MPEKPSVLEGLNDPKVMEQFLKDREAAEASLKAIREMVDKEFKVGKRHPSH